MHVYRGRRIAGWRTLLWVLVLAAGPAGTRADEPDPAQRDYATASGLLQRELYPEAIQQFRAFLEAHGDHARAPLARYGLGVALYRSGQAGEAEKALAPLLTAREFEFAAEVRAVVGQCRLGRGDFPGAAEVLHPFMTELRKQALAPDAAALLVEALYQSGQTKTAADLAAQYLRQWPDAAQRERVLFIRGLALLGEQDWFGAEQSLADLRQAFPQSEHAVQAALLGGRAAFEQGAYERACAVLEPLARQDGDAREVATYWLAKCRLRLEQPAAAATLLAAALEHQPEHVLAAEMRYDRGVALAQAGADESAAAAIREFLERHGEHALAAEALHLCAAIEQRRGRHDECAAACREFARRFPAHSAAAAVALLGAESAYLGGQLEAAVAEYASMLERWPEHERGPQARLRLGLALYRLERFDEAQPHLERVVALSRDDALCSPARLALAEVHFRRGAWQSAAEAYEVYLAGNPASGADEALLKLGLAQQGAGDLAGAEQSFERLVREHPESAWRAQARFEQGQVRVAREDPAGARAAFEAVVASGDAKLVPLAQQHLGVLALRAQDPATAAERFARAAAAHTDPALAAEAHLQQGQALLQAGKYEEAATVLRAFVAANPAHAQAGTARARLVLALAREQRAADALDVVEELRRAGQLEALPPDLARAVAYERAWCLRKLERQEDAARAYRELLAQFTTGPERAYAGLELAELEAAAGRCAESLKLLGEVCAPDADAPAEVRIPALYRIGICAFEQQEHDRAATALTAMLEQAPAHALAATARFYCGEALLQLGRHKAAAEQLGQLVAAKPPDELLAPALLRLGECLVTLQQWSAAEQAFADYLRKYATSEQWYQAQFGVGWARENQGRHAEAIAAYRQVVERHQGPTAARAQFQLGECLFAQHKLDEAVTELLKVDILYAYPEWSAAALYEAGRCFEQLGKTVEARRQFEVVCEKYRDSKWAELAGARLAAVAGDGLPGRNTN